MDLNRLEIDKTGLLFFDILNGYYHQASAAAKGRKKPMVDNAVLLMKAARKARIPIFFAKGHHRVDEGTTVLINTDTNIPLKPWPDGIVTMVKPNTVEGQSSAEVIPELEPSPDDYHLERILSNLSRSRSAVQKDRHDHHLGRLGGRGRCIDGIRRQRHGLQLHRGPRCVRHEP
jgi:nicotinamidase-related amidase